MASSLFQWPVLLTPFPAIALGVLIAYGHGIPLTVFAVNVVAVMLGIPLALFFTGVRERLQRHLTLCSLWALVMMAGASTVLG